MDNKTLDIIVKKREAAEENVSEFDTIIQEVARESILEFLTKEQPQDYFVVHRAIANKYPCLKSEDIESAFNSLWRTQKITKHCCSPAGYDAKYEVKND